MSRTWSEADPAQADPAETPAHSQDTESASSVLEGRTVPVGRPDAERILEAAHEYTRNGWRVLPLHTVGSGGRCSCLSFRRPSCNSQGKHPIDTGWQKAEPLSGADVQATFGEEAVHNLGIATGRDSNVFVVDVDEDKPGAAERWAELQRQHGALPATRVVKTPAGYHYYWRTPAGFEVTNSNRFPVGIDVRGTGGQVVAPPSVSAKGRYEVVNAGPVAAAPDWLLEYVRPVERPERPEVELATLPKLTDLPPEEQERLAKYTQKILDEEIERLQASGQLGDRNIATFEVSCNLIELANSPWSSLEVETAYALVTGKAPIAHDFLRDEVERCWDSAMRRVAGSGRALPEKRPAGPVYPGDPLSDSGARGGGQDAPNASVPGEGGAVVATPGVVKRARLKTVKASDVEDGGVSYLWDQLIPLGAISLLPGEEGIGKTLIGIRLMSDLTRGTLAGEFHGTPRNVLVMATEDSIRDVFKPRLREAGAELERVTFVLARTEKPDDTDDEDDESVILPRDLPLLTPVLQDTGAVFVWIDSLVTTLPEETKTISYKDVNKVLKPISGWADAHEVAVAAPWHLNKASGSDAAVRMMDSRAFRTAIRSVLLVVRDPDAPEGVNAGIVALDKVNAGPGGVPAHRYRIDSEPYTYWGVDRRTGESVEKRTTVGVARWTGLVEGDGREIARAALVPRMDTPGTARDWLRQYLSARGETRRDRVLADADQAGHKRTAITDASANLRVTTRYETGQTDGKPWRRALWSLPSPQSSGQSSNTKTIRTSRTTGEGSERTFRSVSAGQLQSSGSSGSSGSGGEPDDRTTGPLADLTREEITERGRQIRLRATGEQTNS